MACQAVYRVPIFNVHESEMTRAASFSGSQDAGQKHRIRLPEAGAKQHLEIIFLRFLGTKYPSGLRPRLSQQTVLSDSANWIETDDQCKISKEAHLQILLVEQSLRWKSHMFLGGRQLKSERRKRASLPVPSRFRQEKTGEQTLCHGRCLPMPFIDIGGDPTAT